MAERIEENDQYLAFPSIIRDCLLLLTKFKGIKSQNNPGIPEFILENKELIYGWIEQTIADEGHIRFDVKTYRREIIWRRSFTKNLRSYRLNLDERKMLKRIGISLKLNDAGQYKTGTGVEKIRLQIRISCRKNLLRLRRLITIPEKRKDTIFTEMVGSFERYKERLRIKNSIVKICQKKGFVDSVMLKQSMGYKNCNTANKWINFYVYNNLLKCMKKSAYPIGKVGRTAARYVLR